MVKNYIKKISGVSTPVATRWEPQYKDYNGFGDYFDGKQWYSDVAVFADDFSSDTSSEWDALSSAIITYENTAIKVTADGASNGYASNNTAITTIAGKRYLFKARLIKGTSSVFGYRLGVSQLDSTYSGDLSQSYSSTTDISLEFIAESTALYMSFNSADTDKTMYFDNVAIIPLNDDGSIDTSNATAYTTPITYLPITADIDTEGNIVNIDAYDVPTLVEDYVIADKVKAVNEFVGKNACTAWVNFDGVTTPPTIRDGYNVSQVIRTANGTYDIYFEEPMDNNDYTVSGYVAHKNNDITSTEGRILGSSNKSTNRISIKTSYVSSTSGAVTALDNPENSIQIFGGKN